MDNSITNIGKELGSAFGSGSTNLQQGSAAAQQQQPNRQQFVQARSFFCANPAAAATRCDTHAPANSNSLGAFLLVIRTGPKLCRH